MKKLTIIFLLILLSFTTFAQWGTMTISSQNYNERFWVFVDDVLQNQYSVSSIKVQGMNIQQDYRVRIELDNPNQNIVGQTVQIKAQPRFNNYEVQYRNNGYIFKSSNFNYNPMFTMNLILPNYNYYNDYHSFLYPGFGNYGNYWGNSGRKYNFLSAPNDCYPNYGNNQGGNYGNNQGGNYGNNQGGNYGNNQGGNHGNNQGGNHGNNQGGNYGNNQGGNHGNNQGGNHGNNQGGNHGNNQGGGQNLCMPTNDFNTALNSIRSDNFESGKLNKAKQIISRNRMCTAQIMQIVRLFSFESNKLEFAKYAYQYCNDKNNYYQIADAFSFQSSKDDLLRFIGN